MTNPTGNSRWEKEREIIIYPLIAAVVYGISSWLFEEKSALETLILVFSAILGVVFVGLSFLKRWEKHKIRRRVFLGLAIVCTLLFFYVGLRPTVKAAIEEVEELSTLDHCDDFQVVLSRFTSRPDDPLSSNVFMNLTRAKVDTLSPPVGLEVMETKIKETANENEIEKVLKDNCLEEGLLVYGGYYVEEDYWSCIINLSRYRPYQDTLRLSESLWIEKPQNFSIKNIPQSGKFLADIILALLEYRKGKNGLEDLEQVIQSLKKIEEEQLRATGNNYQENFTELFQLLGTLSAKLERWETALNYFDQAHSSDPQNQMVQRNWLVLQYKVNPGEFGSPRIQQELKDLLKSQPYDSDPNLLYLLGQSQNLELEEIEVTNVTSPGEDEEDKKDSEEFEEEDNTGIEEEQKEEKKKPETDTDQDNTNEETGFEGNTIAYVPVAMACQPFSWRSRLYTGSAEKFEYVANYLPNLDLESKEFKNTSYAAINLVKEQNGQNLESLFFEFLKTQSHISIPLEASSFEIRVRFNEREGQYMVELQLIGREEIDLLLYLIVCDNSQTTTVLPRKIGNEQVMSYRKVQYTVGSNPEELPPVGMILIWDIKGGKEKKLPWHRIDRVR